MKTDEKYPVGWGGARPGAGRKPTERKKSTTIRISAANTEKLVRIALREGKTIREIVEDLINNYVE